MTNVSWKVIEIARVIRNTKYVGFYFSTHSVGGGEWSIEVHHPIEGFVCEFVGSNGTHEQADDLWSRAYNAIDAAIAYNTAMFGGGFQAK